MEPLEAFVLYISMILLSVFPVLFLAMEFGILLFWRHRSVTTGVYSAGGQARRAHCRRLNAPSFEKF